MISGSITALVTPFDAQGRVDYLTYARLVERQIESNTDGIVVGGTTGEGLTLSADEFSRLLNLTVEIAHKKTQIIANTGTNNTLQTVERGKEAKEIGVDAQLVIVPYCNLPSQEGVYAHYHAASAIDLPTVLYHHPGRTGITLTDETVDRIMALESLVAIKDSSGHTDFCSKHPTLCGIDTMIDTYLNAGAKGTISVIGNLLPEQWREVVVDRNSARLTTLRPLLEAIDREVNPQGIKCAMECVGLCSSQVRLPLLRASEQTRAEISEKLKLLETALV